jgi:PIN domain nuclease of toxin-antitoxin system
VAEPDSKQVTAKYALRIEKPCEPTLFKCGKCLGDADQIRYRQTQRTGVPVSVENFVISQRRIGDIQSLPVLEHHVWALANLPMHHRDPFDRLLIAQAISEDWTLVTVDPLFANYPVKVMI